MACTMYLKFKFKHSNFSIFIEVYQCCEYLNLQIGESKQVHFDLTLRQIIILYVLKLPKMKRMIIAFQNGCDVVFGRWFCYSLFYFFFNRDYHRIFVWNYHFNAEWQAHITSKHRPSYAIYEFICVHIFIQENKFAYIYVYVQCWSILMLIEP